MKKNQKLQYLLAASLIVNISLFFCIALMFNFSKQEQVKHNNDVLEIYREIIENQFFVLHQLKTAVRDTVTLIEERPAFRSDGWVQLTIAQFRLDQNKWKIYWQDSKDKWHFVEDYAPDEDFEKQLRKVDQDNNGVFWG